MNRLLFVAGIYHNLEDNYEPLLFVRAKENNNYFNTLSNFKIRSVFSEAETYGELHKYAGFDIRAWIAQNINWTEDLAADFVKHLDGNNSTQHLTW